MTLLDILILSGIAVYVIHLIIGKDMTEEYGASYEDKMNFVNIGMNLDELKELLRALDDNDKLGFELIARKFGVSASQLLEYFQVPNIKKLKKKLGLEELDTFDLLARKLGIEGESRIEKHAKEIAEARKEFSRINFEELTNYMLLNLFALTPKQIDTYSKIGLLLHWLHYKGEKEKFEMFKKYYYPPLNDGELPDELRPMIEELVPEIEGSKDWYYNLQERFKVMRNPASANYILIQTVANFFKTKLGIELNTNYSTFDEFFEKEVKKVEEGI